MRERVRNFKSSLRFCVLGMIISLFTTAFVVIVELTTHGGAGIITFESVVTYGLTVNGAIAALFAFGVGIPITERYKAILDKNNEARDAVKDVTFT